MQNENKNGFTKTEENDWSLKYIMLYSLLQLFRENSTLHVLLANVASLSPILNILF